jgi:hypothetical protein
MTLVLDATVGGEDSNTYITLADANTYFESRLYGTTWTSATDDNKNRSLAMATRMLDDLFVFQGDKLTCAQALRWTRSGVYDIDGCYVATDAIPTPIEEATCEQALELLKSDVTTQPELLAKGFKKAKVGPLEVEADLSFQPASMSKNATNAIVGAGLGSLKSSSGRVLRA